MNKEEFKNLQGNKTINVNDLNDLNDRTLIYGYTLDRDTFHVYLENEQIHIIVYTFDKIVKKYLCASWFDVDAVIPSKRAYPEGCDHEFCTLVLNKGGSIPFTVFSDDWENTDTFIGLTSKDFPR